MKRRIRKVANFFAFNLLFFALYLNFIHKDKAAIPGGDQTVQPKTAAFSGTVLVENTDQKNEATATVGSQQPAAAKTEENGGAALKLSIN